MLVSHPSPAGFRNLLQSSSAGPAHLHQVHHFNIDEAALPQKARPVLRKTPTGNERAEADVGARGQTHALCTGGVETESSGGAFERGDAAARASSAEISVTKGCGFLCLCGNEKLNLSSWSRS